MLGFAGTGRPRVLLAIDRPGWAFDHIAQALVRYLSDEFDFAIVPYPDCKAGECDLLVPFWYASVPLLRTDIKARRCLVCLYDGYSWKREDNAKRLAWAFARADAVAVANRRLRDEIALLHDVPAYVVEDGVDTVRFWPSSPPWRFRVGWCGNSFAATTTAGLEDLKGVRLIREACERTDTRLVMADAQDGTMIAHEDMPAWYRGLSGYVCASLVEGTPNPVLEALACGRPVISTAVGVVPDLVRSGDNGWIVERDAGAIMAALEEAKRTDLREMGRRARAAVEAWDWRHKVEMWRVALRETLAGEARCERSRMVAA